MAAYRRVYDSRRLQADCQANWDQLRNPTLGNRVWAATCKLCGGGLQDGLPVVSGGRVMVDTRSGLLTIASMTTDDSGEFLCIASNVVGRMTAERSVDVHSTPPPLSRPSSLRHRHHRHLALRYDTRCYINVRSKANMSQRNLPHATDN